MNNYLLFPTIDERVEEEAIIKSDNYNFSYNDGENEYPLKYHEDPSEYVLEDERGLWNPQKYNLIIKTTLSIENPNILFGSNGVVGYGDSIFVGIKWSSKTTNMRDTVYLFAFDYSYKTVNKEISLEIPENLVRDYCKISLVMSVGEVGYREDNEKHLANMTGMNLAIMNEGKVMVEGKGSEFPIFKSNMEAGKPLWELEFNSDDPENDLFEKPNVQVLLNTNHENFIDIDIDNVDNTTPLFKEIFANSLFAILLNLKEMDLLDKTKDENDFTEGSICHAMHYFIDTFSIDTSSVNSMMNSIRKSVDRKL